jgi:hypothetical protein
MVSNELRQRLEAVFTPPQVEVFVDWAEEYRKNMVKVSDFLELKEIVRDLAEEQRNLAEAQRRTEVKVGELAGTVQRLAEAQVEMQHTQVETQRSIVEMQRSQVEMQQAITQLARGLDEVRSLAGSNAQTLGYMLENEAYRHVPAWLKQQHDIEVVGRMIRQQIGDEEINLLVEARQGAEEIVIVGEAKSRLHLSDLGLLAVKVEVVKERYANLRGRRIVPLLLAHFAPEAVATRAAREGVIVAQSFEW